VTLADVGDGEPVNAALVVLDGATAWSGRAAPPRPTDVQGALRKGVPPVAKSQPTQHRPKGRKEDAADFAGIDRA